MGKNLRILVFTFVLSGVLAGCQTWTDVLGHYEGTLFDRYESEIQGQAVSIDLVRGKRNTAVAEVKDQQGRRLIVLSARKFTPNSFELDLPPPWQGGVRMRKEKECFYGKHPRVTLCFSDSKLLLDVGDESGQSLFTLSADKFKREVPLEMETPRKFRLNETIEIAQNKSFETRTEFIHLIQARRAAKAAYLKLLPRLNLSTTLSNIEPTISSLLNSIGDYAPFLLPNRWMQAREASHSAEAERDAMILMRMDMGSQAEGLSYALARDQESLDLYHYLLTRAQDALDLIQPLEKEGKMMPGSSDHLQAYINWMQLDVIGLKAIVQEDKYSISAALGFHNPNTVDGVEIGEEGHPIAGAAPMIEAELVPLALKRSIELRQMDHLIRIAEYQKKEIYFSWLDPSEDPDTSLSFATGQTLAIARSKIDELLLKREQLQAIVAKKTAGAINEWNAALVAYPLIQSTMEIHERRLNRILSQIRAGSELNTLDIEAVFQDYVAAGLRKLVLVAGFRVAASKLERLLLQGHYISVPPSVEVRNQLFSFEF